MLNQPFFFPGHNPGMCFAAKITKKSLLEMTFGNPSRSAGRKGRGGESAKPSAASSGSSTNPMKRNEEMGRRNRGSSISSLF